MTHLILTVGTGTAGVHSNLAAGLRRTLELLAPDKFWLVPSNAETSRITADLVREGVEGFQAWAEDQPYRSIGHPDSLEDCRRAVREVILAARRQLPRRGRLLVNPTSGTKQMSVGAALAALDEGAGELVFTVGERADGVVKTGTEKIEAFDAGAYFAEHDRMTVFSLGRAGAFAAAASVAARHESLADLAETARCLHEWERQNYSEARKIAAQSRAAALVPVRHALEQLALAAAKPEPQPLVIADLLVTADQLHKRRDYDAALVLSCRACEMGLRRALFEASGLHEPYSLPAIEALAIGGKLKERCRRMSNDGQRTILNLNTVARMLNELGHPLGGSYLHDHELQRLIRVRNDLMHQIRAVTQAEAQSMLQSVNNLLDALTLPARQRRPYDVFADQTR